MDSIFKSSVEFFGEDPKTSTPESFFSLFHKFVQDMEKAFKDNQKELEAKKRQSIQPSLSSEESISKRNTAIRGQDLLNPHSEKKGVMDDLISQLKSGEMYRAKLKSGSLSGSNNTVK
jgi:hypothetical protein